MIIECSAGRQGVLQTDYASLHECRQIIFYLTGAALPKRFGHFSMETLEEATLEAFIVQAFA